MRKFRNSDYYITKDGTLISKKYKKERVMKYNITRKGYFSSRLSFDGKTNNFVIHRIVAEVYIPNPKNKPQVNHKNSNKLDNRVKNLEWVTEKENRIHAVLARKHNNLKLFPDQVKEIREKYKPREYTINMLAREYDVTIGCITGVIYKHNWAHV